MDLIDKYIDLIDKYIGESNTTEKTHLFVGKNRNEGWKQKNDAKVALSSYRDKGAMVSTRPNHKGWWIAIPRSS